MSRELVISRIRDFFTDALAADTFPLEESIRFCKELEPLLVETSTLEARNIALGTAITGFLTKYPATDKPDYRELSATKTELEQAKAALEIELAALKEAAEELVVEEPEPIVEP
jgi:hypothetical protein